MTGSDQSAIVAQLSARLPNLDLSAGDLTLYRSDIYYTSPYLPLAAGQAIMSITPGNHLRPWVGFALLCGYAAAALVIASILLVRRDT